MDLVSCVTNEPKCLPTITCHAPGYLASNSFLTTSAKSFMCAFSPFINELYAAVAVVTANSCIASSASVYTIRTRTPSSVSSVLLIVDDALSTKP
eukprot:CAMPEP_0205903398 /NCGR_PEP_ID=MMETSP1325-20131115/82_1 /ASSEMBLY_ACC=CAM_ASM_000708 /TAXON_ID=236786 /ORGANISM="Florenciella sp., Strain RCC1007" /LENGTH=94 /DNA_ID=CAMNT_0053269051 /DNA_START=92 /DNA_END=376 /DNA_ORIENTATION=+